jgi:uncharacterized membrane protein
VSKLVNRLDVLIFYLIMMLQLTLGFTVCYVIYTKYDDLKTSKLTCEFKETK